MAIMLPDLAVCPMTAGLKERLARKPAPGVRLFWIGQAGFVIEAAGRRIVIDPYLSDSLRVKYQERAFPHDRMMPPPVDIDGLGHVDLVLVTHGHTDHMDPATLQPLFATRRTARLVAPAALERLAAERSGLPPERLLTLDAGESILACPGITITATPAAHERREQDEQGLERFLGYMVEADGLRLWHSGDCVPFNGLVEIVKELEPDIALLPVNGRRPELSANGVPGNFTIKEAIDTATAVGAKTLIAHHYGMFAFNTADPREIDALFADGSLQLLRARTGVCYEYRCR